MSGYYSIWKVYHDPDKPASFQQGNMLREQCERLLRDPSARTPAWHLEMRKMTPLRPSPDTSLVGLSKAERDTIRQARKDALFSHAETAVENS